jgi:Flp pilus assembly protein TadG
VAACRSGAELTMYPDDTNGVGAAAPGARRRRPLSALFRSKDGAAAIEFALLAIPYFIIVFAIIETFVAFAAEQLVGNAVDTMSRKLRTGAITVNHNPATDMDRTQFRQAFCNEISILIQCSASEVATPNKLWIDVRTFASFSLMATMAPGIPKTAAGDLNTASMAYAPGGASTPNMLRAYYKWSVITDLVRPYVTNMQPTDGTQSYYLIAQGSVFQTEDYP